MGTYSSYYLYQKYQIIGNQDPIPVIPLTYSVSGDTLDPQPLVEKLENDPKCGYVPPVEYQYRDIESGYTCVDLDKYTKIVSQRSSDGIHWENVSYSAGTLIQQNSSDCGYIGTIYRLKASGTTCYQGDKYMQMVEQVSNDNIHWTNTGRVERGYLIESDSPDCIEYRWVNMDISTDWVCDDCPELKLKATYSDSTTYYVDCNSSTTLSSTEVSGHSTTKSLMTTAEIGNCATIIGSYAFYNCRSLTNIVIPDNVTSIWAFAFCKCTGLTGCDIGSGVTAIGDYAFRECYSLTSIDIPSGVTAIGVYAFRECYSLTSITVNALVPPTLGVNAFYETNNCPIYVPAASVSAYQSASGWSTYASRIQAIP